MSGPSNVSKASSMNMFRALNPTMDNRTAALLEDSLNVSDNSLFTLLMNSDWPIHETNQEAIRSLFNYVQAGWDVATAVRSLCTPIQQRAALKVLICCIHRNLEKALDQIDETLF